jgi:hypothetical protein
VIRAPSRRAAGDFFLGGRNPTQKHLGQKNKNAPVLIFLPSIFLLSAARRVFRRGVISLRFLS